MDLNAFDGVPHGEMLWKLKVYSLSETFVDAIGLMREGTQARVITQDGETEFVDIMTDVLQGDKLASYLFAIILEYALRMAIGGKEKEIRFKLDRRRSRSMNQCSWLTKTLLTTMATISEEMDPSQNMLRNTEL